MLPCGEGYKGESKVAGQSRVADDYDESQLFGVCFKAREKAERAEAAWTEGRGLAEILYSSGLSRESKRSESTLTGLKCSLRISFRYLFIFFA